MRHKAGSIRHGMHSNEEETGQEFHIFMDDDLMPIAHICHVCHHLQIEWHSIMCESWPYDFRSVRWHGALHFTARDWLRASFRNELWNYAIINVSTNSLRTVWLIWDFMDLPCLYRLWYGFKVKPFMFQWLLFINILSNWSLVWTWPTDEAACTHITGDLLCV